MATAVQNSSEVNEQLAELYKKAGIDTQGQPGEEKKEPAAPPEEKVFTRTVNINGQPRTYTGTTEADVLSQVVAAVEAQPAPIVKEPPKEEPKPISQDRLFALGLDIAKGDPKAIDAYLTESGYLERMLKGHGLTLDGLKTAVQSSGSAEQRQAAESAATSWLNREGNDWPGGKGNMKILGFTLASMGLKPGDPESYERAYQQMKAEGMVLPNPDVKKEEKTEKRPAKSSTAFGAGAEHEARKPAAEKIPTISRAAWDKMTPAQQAAEYNDLVARGMREGFTAEDIKFVA